MTQKIHLKAFLVSDRSDSYQINALKQLLNPDRLHIYGQVIFGKGAKNIQKGQSSQQMVPGKLDVQM